MLLLNLIRNNSRELLNEDLIKKVQMNDTAAILTLLDIFESEIKKNSYRKLYDEWGNLAAVVYDEDISSQLKVILIDAFKKIKLDFSISDNKKALKFFSELSICLNPHNMLKFNHRLRFSPDHQHMIENVAEEQMIDDEMVGEILEFINLPIPYQVIWNHGLNAITSL